MAAMENPGHRDRATNFPNDFLGVDMVVRHWVTGVIADAEERGKLGKEGRHQASLFYADDGMVD